MNTDRLTALFEELKQLEQSKPEATFLSIGGRGYYENPASDLLQFFLVPSNAHGLDTLFIEALFEVTGVSYSEASLEGFTVQREVHTTNNNRIDLLLKGEGWIMLIENKIWHEQINPFEDYEALAKLRMKSDDQAYYVILSPSGESRQKDWTGLSYRKLIDALQIRLTKYANEFEKTKWWHFAQDFILHLDQELYTKAMTLKEIEFVEAHADDLTEAVKLHDRYRNHLIKYLPACINKGCQASETFAQDGGWCIRIKHPTWGPSNIAWAHDPQDENRLKLTVYLDSPEATQQEEARAFFEGNRGMSYREEANGRWQCWRTSIGFQSRAHAEDELIKLSAELFKLFEK